MATSTNFKPQAFASERKNLQVTVMPSHIFGCGSPLDLITVNIWYYHLLYCDCKVIPKGSIINMYWWFDIFLRGFIPSLPLLWDPKLFGTRLLFSDSPTTCLWYQCQYSWNKTISKNSPVSVTILLVCLHVKGACTISLKWINCKTTQQVNSCGLP